MDLLKLPNVKRSPYDSHESDFINTADWLRKRYQLFVDVSNDDIPLKPSSEMLTELVSKLVVDKPEWQFHVYSYKTNQTGQKEFGLVWNSVSILSPYGQNLGAVTYSHRWGKHGRTDTLEVHNHRVSAARERANCFSTSDVKAAIREVKKSFYEKTVDELLEEAHTEARSAIAEAQRIPKHAVRITKREFEGRDDQLVDYVIDHHKEHFSAWLDAKRGWASGRTLEMMDAMANNHNILDTVEEVERAFRSNRTALIIKNQGGYILRIDKEVKLCDDSTLPENIKAKLGMLKLVEKSQVISNVGCRVNEETFVVVLDATEEQ